MIKSEIDVWVRSRPDYQELGLVRNASALTAELMGCGKKRERKRTDRVLSLSPQVCLRLCCFVLSSIIPEDDARAMAR